MLLYLYIIFFFTLKVIKLADKRHDMATYLENMECALSDADCDAAGISHLLKKFCYCACDI